MQLIGFTPNELYNSLIVNSSHLISSKILSGNSYKRNVTLLKTVKMIKEFKAFILRGNVVDLAVAVIIGAAFGAIVSSLVTDVITPLLLNPLMEKLHVSKLEEVAWNGVLYGKFIATVINFVVVAFVIFLMVKGMNKMIKKKEVAPAPKEPTNEEKLLTEIRDLLKSKQ